MRIRISAVIALLSVTLVPVGCRSKPTAGKSEEAALPGSSSGRDAGVKAALQASDRWSGARCRWLETGTWILAYSQDTALYRAAHELGYIEMEEVGQGNRIGVPEPAWRIALTEAGKVEAANCPPQSKPTAWGIPVSWRKLISATYVGQDNGERTIYEVEYAWVPTAVGEKVKHVLTDKMTVEEGTYRTKVYLRGGPDLIAPGANKWVVLEINDFDAVRLD